MRDADLYRMRPALVLLLTGVPVVAVGVCLLALTAIAAASGWPAQPVVLGAALGALVVVGYVGWLRRAWLVRLDAAGYRIRVLRGVGARDGTWNDVREAVAASPGGIPCVLLHRHDGTDTVIPLRTLDADPDAFARAVVARLRARVADDVPDDVTAD